ncbi:hypothetical protein RB653_001519 [Dictyostelium firmibasis]|uniref:RBR-type E3 ubiquitin transferase n=1 Tax=Dictyostelium firmibasis TaxID=79012 RepID=A0AAN7U575_9MYCE
MKNSNKKNEEELYVSVENPDNRKRFTIFYEKNELEKESCVLIIQDTLSFFGFLGLLINKFKLDSSLKSYIRVFTDEGCRIKSLKKTFNNQIIKFKISTLSDEDPEDEKTNKLLTKSQEYAQELLEKSDFLKKSQINFLQLFNHTEENHNLFYNNVIKKLITHTTSPPFFTQNNNKNNNNNNKPSTQSTIEPLNKIKTYLIIGESYPYCCKLLISEINNSSRIWVYFMEEIQNPQNKEFKIDILIENDDYNDSKGEMKLSNKSKEILNLIKDKENVLDIVNYLENYYKSNFIDSSDNDDDDDDDYDDDENNNNKNKNKNKNNKFQINKFGPISTNLFKDFKKCKTVTKNKLLDECYTSISKVSTYYDIPISLSRKLLFQNQWKLKQIIGTAKDKEKNLLNIKSFSCTHRVKDISLFKFNSITTTITPTTTTTIENSSPILIECSICCCEYSSQSSSEQMIELLCGHRFCKECMISYFRVSIQDGNGAMNQIKCPQSQCLNNCIDEVTIEITLNQDNNIYSKRNLKNFIKDITYSRPNTFQCPEIDCNRLLLLDNNNNRINCYSPYVQCNDEHIFCLYCKQPGLHWPMPCNKNVNLGNELLSYEWIIRNTIICDKCKYPIEKNGGCNHLTCSRCGYQFCYICGKDYWIHNHNKCSRSNGVLNFLKVFTNGTNNFDIKMLDSFLAHGKSNDGGDPIVSHIYNSFITTITDGSFANKDYLKYLQNLVFYLNSLLNSRIGSLEEASNLFSTQKLLKRILSPISNSNEIKLFPIIKSFYNQLYNNNNNSNSNDDGNNNRLVNSLLVTICLNGSKKSLFKLFVNSQFNQFKEEIVFKLNKTIISKDQIEYDSKKIRLYNLYGGQIKNSNEILNNEIIFITSSIYEVFIEDPQLPTEIEQENQQQQQQQQQQRNEETLSPKKEKRKNDIFKLKEMIQSKLEIKQDIDHLKNHYQDENQQEYTIEEIFNQFYIVKNSSLLNINNDNNNNNSSSSYENNNDNIDMNKIVISSDNSSKNENENENESLDVEDKDKEDHNEEEEGEDYDESEKKIYLKIESEEEIREKREKQIELAWNVIESFNVVDEALLDFDTVLNELVNNNTTDLESATKVISLKLRHFFIYDQYDYDSMGESFRSPNKNEYYDHDEDLALSKIYKKSVSKFKGY